MPPVFALNHMTVAKHRYDELFAVASELGCVGIELRNDLNRELFEGDAPEIVRGLAAEYELRILGLSEIKAFNHWTDKRAEEAEALMKTAIAIGAETVSLIPRCDGIGLGKGERLSNLRLALGELKPRLEAHNLVGIVEPLGFEHSSLRFKSEAVETIEMLGATSTFKLVHDTFHHHLAGNGPLFADHTALVHVSGVSDPDVQTNEMRDEHRILVDASDRLGNTAQIADLAADGYHGPISFECFAPSVHEFAEPVAEISKSIRFFERRLAQ